MPKISSYHKRLEQYRTSSLKAADKTADFIAFWCGSWNFLILHLVWFTVWFVFKLPLEVLTLIVSLEAIILMGILLMYQNRQARKDELRDEADYQADKHAEADIAELKKIVKEMNEKIK